MKLSEILGSPRKRCRSDRVAAYILARRHEKVEHRCKNVFFFAVYIFMSTIHRRGFNPGGKISTKLHELHIV